MALERSGDVEFGDYLVEDESLNASSHDDSNPKEREPTHSENSTYQITDISRILGK